MVFEEIFLLPSIIIFEFFTLSAKELFNNKTKQTKAERKSLKNFIIYQQQRFHN